MASSSTAARPSADALRRAAPIGFAGVGRTFTVAGGERVVLRGVDLDVAAGEIVAIIGPSGCGKSTLLRLAGGLDEPSEGRIAIDGTPVAAYDDRSAIGFQEPRLLPWRSLADNVALGLPRGAHSRRDAEAIVGRLLELVGLADSAGHRPREVSGGMAQRASLARALARTPAVLLLDEPFGALDALTRLRMQDLLLDVHRTEPTTVLLVTHDVDEALQLADRVVLLGANESGANKSGANNSGASKSGANEDGAGAGIRRIVEVPGARPRDRGSAELAELRAELLEGLGVDRHEHGTGGVASGGRRAGASAPEHARLAS
ncbi:ABC transporter ATP-binding protein [Agromyces archimandritae]|uniref:ABC transporter ATP-binding protein n=1 Tax=Agromyces archimandritae TaxID=2781962 RepID=A0A975FRJ7_9MICO|nr:ABC transporter ATP-binding protein [Agromyces archimandritae]QTX05926.1 ABC transporter ATP-binding protein [Agromyces archimandritae]